MWICEVFSVHIQFGVRVYARYHVHKGKWMCVSVFKLICREVSETGFPFSVSVPTA